MEQQSSKVLLVHNRFSLWQPITWLGFIIRVVTCSKWNHAAILHNGYVWESVGRGIICTPYGEWEAKANRTVLVMKPKDPINIRLRVGNYGFLDLLQIFLHIIRTKWIGIGNDWNGESGTKLWKGFICSEFVGLSLGAPKAYLLTPADILHLPGLTIEKEFETRKAL